MFLQCLGPSSQLRRIPQGGKNRLCRDFAEAISMLWSDFWRSPIRQLLDRFGRGTRISYFRGTKKLFWQRTDSVNMASWGSLAVVPRVDFDHVRFSEKKYFFEKKFFSLDSARDTLQLRGIARAKNSVHYRVMSGSTWLRGPINFVKK